MIISKDLVVSSCKKAGIIEELHQKKFQPFPKAAKVKAVGVGETEDIEANNDTNTKEATSGTSADYNNLLGMVIWSLTKEKVHRPAPACMPLIAHFFFSFWLIDREAPSASC